MIDPKAIVKRIRDRQEAAKAKRRVMYSLRLPAPLWEALGAYCETNGTSRTRLIEELIRATISDPPVKSRPRTDRKTENRKKS